MSLMIDGPREYEEAREQLLSSAPSDSDGVVALRLAKCLTAEAGYRGRYYVHVISDVRKAACPLPVSHRYKNVLCFSTDNRDAAMGWIVQAALLGYSVTRGYSNKSPTSGFGTISNIRAHAQRQT